MCGFLQLADAGVGLRRTRTRRRRSAGRRREREKEDGPLHRMSAYTMRARSCVAGNQRRIPRRGPTRKMEPATTTRSPGAHAAAPQRADRDRLDARRGRPTRPPHRASSRGGIARGESAVVQITRPISGSSGARMPRDVLVPHRPEDQRRRRCQPRHGGKTPARARRPGCAPRPAARPRRASVRCSSRAGHRAVGQPGANRRRPRPRTRASSTRLEQAHRNCGVVDLMPSGERKRHAVAARALPIAGPLS